MKTSRNLAALCRIIVPVLLVLMLGRQSLHAQTANPPGMISYQGFLIDNNGLPLATNAPKNYNIIFRIYNSATGGDTNSALWAEQQVVTVDKGYFSVLLGQGSAVGSQPNTNNLTTLFTGITASDRYIGMVVQGLAVGGDVEITPRLRLLASPYSLLAANANAIVDSSGSNVLSAFAGSVGIDKGGFPPQSALDVNGTVTASHFSGAGDLLTGLNASAVTTGTLPNSALPTNPTINGNTTVLGNVFVQNGLLVGGNTIVDGTISDVKWGVTQPIPWNGGALPRTSTFTANGGTLMITFTGACYATSVGYHAINLQVDGVYKGQIALYFNQINVNMALPGNTVILKGVAAGSHTIGLYAGDANMTVDGNDTTQVTVMELPF